MTYSKGGILTFDVSDNANVLSRLSVSHRNSAVTSHVMGETVVIYDISSGPYLKPIYQNSSETTGNALSLIANDSSSNTFMNILTPNSQGISIGGGVYPNDQSRSMGTIGWRDPSANYTPSINIVSGTSHIRNKTTIGMNTHAPTTESYTFDINGPIHVKNGELTIANQSSIDILHLGVGKTAQKNAVAIGSPYEISTIGTKTIYKQKILYTNDGGENWIENYDLSGGSIATQDKPLNLNAVFVYDASLTIIGGDMAYSYYTYNGYSKSGAWKTISSSYNVSGSSTNIKSIYVKSGTSKRAFWGMDDISVTNPISFIYHFNIPDNNSGINADVSSNLPENSSLSFTGINAMDGCGNLLCIVGGRNIVIKDITEQINENYEAQKLILANN
jgi:hypothetical protein